MKKTTVLCWQSSTSLKLFPLKRRGLSSPLPKRGGLSSPTSTREAYLLPKRESIRLPSSLKSRSYLSRESGEVRQRCRPLEIRPRRAFVRSIFTSLLDQRQSIHRTSPVIASKPRPLPVKLVTALLI